MSVYIDDFLTERAWIAAHRKRVEIIQAPKEYRNEHLLVDHMAISYDYVAEDDYVVPSFTIVPEYEAILEQNAMNRISVAKKRLQAAQHAYLEITGERLNDIDMEAILQAVDAVARA